MFERLVPEEELTADGAGVLEFDASLSFPQFSFSAGLRVSADRTTVLVGPSGSGKTTCLNLISGLLRPDRGRIVLGGRVLCDTGRQICLPPERRAVGLLFQNYALFPHMTVRDNIAFGPRMRRRPQNECHAAASYWLERLQIGDCADRRVNALSAGQRQRVALARALAAEPRCILLDEPFSALDVATSMTVRRELRDFLGGVSLPTVLVTHDPMDALVFGDQIVVVEKGRVTQAGPREELLRRPRTPFAADLTGLNLYQAELGEGSGLREARVGPLQFYVAADGSAGPAYLAFAPSAVEISHDRVEGPVCNVFRGAVADVLPLPDRIRVTLDVGIPLAAEVTWEAAASLRLATGSPVRAAVKSEVIMVYR